MAHHAVEIILTRPITPGELRRACRSVPVATNADRTRLMAVHGARSRGGALHTLRRRLDALLPIDVLTTHYPDRRGRVMLNVALPHTADQALRQAAAATGQRPQDVLRRRVSEALARDEQDRARLLTTRLEGLLAHHTPEKVLTSVASLLHSRPYRHTPAP
ncbi:hypothetical protein M2271_007740 [Streptomyces sp. LBL]|uniref:hypothetical protein n=1 Tax=Streptomyces sp. LBL TaxID=2940562 RepID=UPI002476DC2D|nr:hypothetical protein [Streptomyces sp. LBL]MDH6629891.1 hypothetical protein [Streptomyces sp. LBL]